MVCFLWVSKFLFGCTIVPQSKFPHLESLSAIHDLYHPASRICCTLQVLSINWWHSRRSRVIFWAFFFFFQWHNHSDILSLLVTQVRQCHWLSELCLVCKFCMLPLNTYHVSVILHPFLKLQEAWVQQAGQKAKRLETWSLGCRSSLKVLATVTVILGALRLDCVGCLFQNYLCQLFWDH